MRNYWVRTMEQTVFTIGHSTHRQEYFVALLMRHGITAVCDVRSKPYSRLHASGELEGHADALDRLRRLLRLPEADLFRGYDEILADAYRRQEQRIAYEQTSAAVAGAG